MATLTKPVRTGSAHTLPFEKLSALDFERLCLGLVIREGFERAEHLGEAGGENGRDVVAWKEGRRFVFQCKRVRSFAAADALTEIQRLRRLPVEEQPHELVFVVSRSVSTGARSSARKEWGDEATCHFWAGSELDERVNRYPDLRDQFFQLPSAVAPAPFRHNLPFASLGRLFQGRDEILTILRKKLTEKTAGRATAIAGKAVHGLGGVGKSRLAIEYAWRYAAEYSAILFVGAGSPADLRRNTAALSKVLDLPERETTDEEIQVEAVLRRLAERPGWLLILDNIDTKEAAVAVDALIAQLHGGDVLLTGRLAHWGAEVEPIELDVLAEEAAVAFLLARTEGRRRTTKDDDVQARALARKVGCLPLALEQAGACIAERRLTLGGYLKEWHSRHEQVLTWFDPRVSHYPASVAVTWQTSFDRLTARSQRLIERLAWLGPEPIPETLLDVSVPDLPDAEADLDAHEALVALATYSLVTHSTDMPTFTVHRLVQDVTRSSLRNDPCQGPLNEALRWMDAAFDGDPQDVRTWPVLDPLSPHVRAVVSFADSLEIAVPTATLMNNLAQLLDAKAMLGEAEPLMRRTLAIAEKSFGTKHPEVAIRLNNLAQLLQATNRLAEAEPLLLRALAIDETLFGTEHPRVAVRLSNLAMLFHETNRLAEAEPLMRRALAIDEATYGAEHPNVARDLNNLAQLLDAKTLQSEAEPLMRRALAIDEKNFATEHPNVSRDLNNLAQLLKDTNRLEEAEPLMRRVLANEERSFGEHHPRVAVALNNLAQLLQDTNRLAEAEPLIRRALAIDEKAFGLEHSNIAINRNNLAQLLLATNRLGEAEPLMRWVLSTIEISLGENHPNVATALNNLGQLLQTTKRLAEAEPLMRQGLVILLDFTHRIGREHPNLRTAFDNYLGVLQEMGKSDAEIEAALAALARGRNSE